MLTGSLAGSPVGTEPSLGDDDGLVDESVAGADEFVVGSEPAVGVEDVGPLEHAANDNTATQANEMRSRMFIAQSYGEKPLIALYLPILVISLTNNSGANRHP